MAYETKVYAAQKADAEGNLGQLLALKLTLAAAHAVARRYAPAKVHFALADKSEALNVGQVPSQRVCN